MGKQIVDPDAKKPDDWDDEEEGDWDVKRISNPEYKGIWTAKKIANPEYVDDDSVYKYADFGFLGFDLWQVKGGTIFDNIIITDDVGEADSFAKKWKELSEVEKAAKKAEDDSKKSEEPESRSDDDADEDDEDDEGEDTKEEEEM